MSMKTPPAKTRRFQKPGLWFSTQRAEIEEVTKAHKKLCEGCARLPVGWRLKATKGAGRHATTTVWCINCGKHWIEDFIELAKRAGLYLKGNLESVRDPNG